jgi:hypothetical protein
MTLPASTVIAILKKDAPANLVSLIVLWPLITGIEFLLAGGLDTGVVLINSCLITVLIVGSILVNEIEEEANGGYRIFDSLPTRRAEIVHAKFLSVLFMTIALASTHYLLASVRPMDPRQSSTVLMVVISSGVITLGAAGFLYIGVFLFGLSRAVSIIGISFWIISAILIILAVAAGLNVGSLIRSLVQTLGRTNRFLILAVGLSVFALTWLIATHAVSIDGRRLFRQDPSRTSVSRHTQRGNSRG